MALHTELPIYKAAYNLLQTVTELTAQFPRNYRASMGEQIRCECVNALTTVARAEHDYQLRNISPPHTEIDLPPYLTLAERCGALLGAVDLVDCVTKHNSSWFYGPYGLVLANPTPYRHAVPYKGMLGLFEVPDVVVTGTR